MPATYDLTTPAGQARLHIPDTNTAQAIFSDAEIAYLLEQNQNDPRLAAANALEIIAGDPARLIQFSRGAVSGARTTTQDLRHRALELRAAARGGGIIVGTIERTDFW